MPVGHSEAPQKQEGVRHRGRGRGRARGRGRGRGRGANGAGSAPREEDSTCSDTAAGQSECASAEPPCAAEDKGPVKPAEEKKEKGSVQTGGESPKQSSEKGGCGEEDGDEAHKSVCERCLQRALVVCVDEECKSTVEDVMDAFVKSFALRLGLEESAVPVKVLGPRRAIVFLTTPMQGMSLVLPVHNRLILSAV